MTTSASHPSALVTTKRSARMSRTYITWLVIMALLAFVSVLLQLFYPTGIVDPTQAMFFTWPALAIVALIGLMGIWLAGRTGFPEDWDARIPTGRRFVLPLCLGVVAGSLLVGLDVVTGFTQALATGHGVAQQYTGFVPMLLTFTAAAVFIQVIYRLLFVPGPLWLISNVLLHGRAQVPVFWVLAVLTSVLEPLTQWTDLNAVPGAVFLTRLAMMFGLNLVEVVTWRKYGLLAMILVRVGFYIVWHVLYVH